MREREVDDLRLLPHRLFDDLIGDVPHAYRRSFAGGTWAAAKEWMMAVFADVARFAIILADDQGADLIVAQISQDIFRARDRSFYFLAGLLQENIRQLILLLALEISDHLQAPLLDLRDILIGAREIRTHNLLSHLPRQEFPEALDKLLARADDQIRDPLFAHEFFHRAGDFLKMPERLERDVKVKLSDTAKNIYMEMEREMVAELMDKTIDAVNAAVLTNKLIQMASGAVYDDQGSIAELHSSKLDALEDLIEAANGKPVLIYYNYRHERIRIKERFKEAVEIKTPEDFKAWNKGEISIAMAHPASMGHGLNLQHGGSTVIWFSLPWSLELYSQANARLWRQGQKDTVVIFRLLAEGTIDRDVARALEKKDVTQEALMQAVKARVTDG